MTVQESVWDWFTTALLHDLAKTRLDKDGVWRDHNFLARPLPASLYPILTHVPIDFVSLLGESAIARISQQHTIQKQKLEELDEGDMLAFAVAIADKAQKAMHGITDAEDKSLETRYAKKIYPGLNRVNDHYSFYPYYGAPEHVKLPGRGIGGYTEKTAAPIFAGTFWDLKREGVTLKTLLDIQRNLLRFPHTTYIPHLSLGLHQQLAADLFYFAYRALKKITSGDVRALKELVFYLVAVRPEPLALYYRMRDLQVYKNTSADLANAVFDLLFAEFKTDLPELAVDCNPFVFFHQTALVFLYDDREQIQHALDRLAELPITENYRALNAEISEYRIQLWDNERLFANPNIAVKQETKPLLPRSAKTFHVVSPRRCVRCGEPILSESSDGLCNPCRQLLREYGEKTVSLDDVARGENVETTRLGYLFLRLQEPLLENAQATAKDLIAQFEAERGFAPRGLLHPTKTGLLEYLQAVLEIGDLQSEFQNSDELTPIVQFPELMIYVMNEAEYYENIETVMARLSDLKLRFTLKGMLVARKTPFWSLMDDLATGALTHESRAAFYDFYGGEPVMFTDQEIQAIRRLAGGIDPESNVKTQLNILIRRAANDSLQGLLLDLDGRIRQGKIYGGIGNPLRDELNKISGDDAKTGLKRALFIKNITRLIRRPPQGQRHNRSRQQTPNRQAGTSRSS